MDQGSDRQGVSPTLTEFEYQMTIRELLQQAIPQLADAGVDTPRLDAELLLTHLLNQTRGWLWAHADDAVPDETVAEFERLLARRLRREPLPYILGEWEFYGRSFLVTPDVLIPRPETELLVELVLAWARRHDARLIADVGTGSGAIAITLAAEMPSLRVVAIDLSPAALTVARRNAERLGVSERIEFLPGDLLQPLRDASRGPLDAIAANLPYIAAEEYPQLMPEVRDYEPSQALLAEECGLALIRRLIQESSGVLKSHGLLALEAGLGQAEQVAAIFRISGWSEIHICTDYGGIPRHISAESPL